MSSTPASSRHESKSAAHHHHHHSHGKAPKLPGRPKAITTGMSLLRNVRAYLTPTGSQTHLAGSRASDALVFSKAKTETDLFAATRPDVDGDECLRDCEGCSAHYPAKFNVDEDDALYGHVKGWETHLIVGTGKTDWVRDVTDEKGTVMQAVGRVGVDRKNGKVMLSASNMPSGAEAHHGRGGDDDDEEDGSDCLLLPAWTLIEDVKPSQVEALMREVIETSVTNSTPLNARKNVVSNGHANGHVPNVEQQETGTEKDQVNGHNDALDISGLQIGGGANAASTPESTEQAQTVPVTESQQQQHVTSEESTNTLEPATVPPSISANFKTRPIPHSYLILMCSHKTRDARCGQSAPLLRKEFERILRPMGLYRDLHDDRPGGVGIYFINHVGGHKYSANIMIYRRAGAKRPDALNGTTKHDAPPLHEEAVQLMWLARVRPEDCENIVRYTILQGKLVKPQRQLRGGFDRERGLTSW